MTQQTSNSYIRIGGQLGILTALAIFISAMSTVVFASPVET